MPCGTGTALGLAPRATASGPSENQSCALLVPESRTSGRRFAGTTPGAVTAHTLPSVRCWSGLKRGTLLAVLGLAVALGSWVWAQQPTGENGANIGAGLGVFAGAAILLTGLWLVL